MSLAGIYLENIIPRKEGIRKPCLFCCKKKFWSEPKDKLGKVRVQNDDKDFV
jgi:hypothetical protein